MRYRIDYTFSGIGYTEVEANNLIDATEKFYESDTELEYEAKNHYEITTIKEEQDKVLDLNN